MTYLDTVPFKYSYLSFKKLSEFRLAEAKSGFSVAHVLMHFFLNTLILK
jgi:hypothetical protein